MFLHILHDLMNGYAEEINWQRNLKKCDDSRLFADETCWVILNSGMKEQIVRLIWNRIKQAWSESKKTETAFNHKGKVKAIDYVQENASYLFAKWQHAEDKMQCLREIPFIGDITCWHLAKNLGEDVVKPDRHLVRIANQYDTTPNELCEKLSKETGEKKCVIDIVLWRAANLKMI